MCRSAKAQSVTFMKSVVSVAHFKGVRKSMAAKLLEIAASIVKARTLACKICLEEIEQILIETFIALQHMQNAEQQGVLLESAHESATATPQGKVLQTARRAE
jgi:hypothetical protein